MREVICMNHRELTRLEILQRIDDRRLNQTQAATMLGMSPRQMRRLVRSYQAKGPKGLVSSLGPQEAAEAPRAVSAVRDAAGRRHLASAYSET
jgi:hypothetical protein